ncbi:MAG TPA: universal stress protein [Thermoleophilia bacterium]|nr:universal stress protein [Thermoleophilia bacterium]HQG03687.1 universal stress protein [Thermoleophilia bacterium]HQG54389.1 universal stress protein [Thermoleophilia bacterium]HQJ97936.1 universal stress protein [Thermoleophilia bacterium]
MAQGQGVNLLVALGGGPTDGELLAVARGVAAAADWSLRAVHVRDPRGAGTDALDGIDLTDVELIETEGAPVAEIERLVAAGADAVAFGARARPAPGIGGVALALLGALDVPMLVVRPGVRPVERLRRIVVPLEGSPSASVAMKHADDAFCARGREIVMLHVVTSDAPLEPGSLPAPRLMDQEHYEWKAWQEEFTMRFSQCVEGGRHRVSVRVGDPPTAILREIRDLDAELVVVSWRGTLAEDRAPVVRALLEGSPCAIYLVPAAPETS